jgi:hypothetical protein
MSRKPKGIEKQSVKLQVTITPMESEALDRLAIELSKPGHLVQRSALVRELILRAVKKYLPPE